MFFDGRFVGWLAIASVGAACFSAGCASTGTYVWYTTLPREEWGQGSNEYVIGVGDSLTVKVYEQDGLGALVKVRNDGRIALTLVGELLVAGKHPSAVATEIETQLKRFIVAPRVTVNVESSQPITVTAVGELKTGGAITLEPPAHLLDAVAKAGGPNEFASESRIFLLRQYPAFRRIRFTYKAIVNNEAGAATFPLRNGDVIVVE